jgi:murein L,D-transpeptidase YcbB/YkuD
MQSSLKTIVGIGLALSLMAPALAQASSLTAAQVNAIVALLQSFGADANTVNNVQAALNGQTISGGSSAEASSTPGMPNQGACAVLTRNLHEGDQGDDVRQLQQVLAEDPESGFTASSTGFFGPMTAEAMRNFQMHNGIASSTDGSVGPLTRGFFEHRCGEGLGNNRGNSENRPMMGAGAGTTTPEGDQ